MSATVITTTGWSAGQTNTQLPAGASLPEQASAQGGLGQTMFFDGSGNVALNDGTVPGLTCAGVVWPERLSPLSTVAASAFAQMHQGFGGGVPASTAANDGFTAADQPAIAWEAGNGTPGRKSFGTSGNRSIMGLVFGLRTDGTPNTWAGPQASIMARAFMMAETESIAVAYPADASAATDIGSTTVTTSALMIPRPKRRQIVQSIEIIPSANVAVSSGNDRTITIWKVDTLGVAADVSIATFVTTTAMAAPNAANCLTAHLVSTFTLTATTANLVLRETDMLCYSTVHASSGVVIPQSAIRINSKAI